MKITKLQQAIIDYLHRRSTSEAFRWATTFQMLEAEELQDFWFLRARLYWALDELVDMGIVCRDAMHTGPERGFLPRFKYCLTKIITDWAP